MSAKIVNVGIFLNMFNAKNKDELIENLEQIAPSLVEYYLDETILNNCEETLLLPSNIEETIKVTIDADIYLDYQNEYYINKKYSNTDVDSASFLF